MKRKLIYPIVLILAISCKPKTGDFSCTCDVTPTFGTAKTVTDTIIDKTASDAQEMCNEWGQRLVNGNGKWKCVTKAL